MENQNYEKLDLEKQLCFPLYAASREFVKKYKPYLDEIGLTYTQYLVMLVFWQEKHINVKELGRKLYLDSGTLTPVLKHLEAKGLVSRHRSTEDERVLNVEITEEGMKLREKASEIPSKLVKCVNLTYEEALELYRLLYKFLGDEKSSLC